VVRAQPTDCDPGASKNKNWSRIRSMSTSVQDRLIGPYLRRCRRPGSRHPPGSRFHPRGEDGRPRPCSPAMAGDMAVRGRSRAAVLRRRRGWAVGPVRPQFLVRGRVAEAVRVRATSPPHGAVLVLGDEKACGQLVGERRVCSLYRSGQKLSTGGSFSMIERTMRHACQATCGQHHRRG